MKPLDTFHPFLDTPENGTTPALGCSAHYFEIVLDARGGVVRPGLRLVDVSDAVTCGRSATTA